MSAIKSTPLEVSLIVGMNFFITQVTVKNDVNYIGTCVLCEEWEEIWIKTGNRTPASMGLI